MSRHPNQLFCALAASILTGVLVAPSAHADDASCKPVAAALLAQAGAAYRASITFNNTSGVEEIYTKTAIYRGHGGHWTTIPATPQQREAANREVGASLSVCQSLREETVDGQAATVYAAHSQTATPASSGDMQLWIAASTGIPLKVDYDVRMSGKVSHVSKHYTYDNVQPPAGAT